MDIPKPDSIRPDTQNKTKSKTDDPDHSYFTRLSYEKLNSEATNVSHIRLATKRTFEIDSDDTSSSCYCW